VIGIVQAFDELGRTAASGAASASAVAPQAVMSSIAEALVATAVGIGVAIPAVVAFNYFLRASKAALSAADMLSRDVLAYLERGDRARRTSVTIAELRMAPSPSPMLSAQQEGGRA
jgi:biopolymer transport protein ExbB